MSETDELLQRITIRPSQCGGRACIRGIRIRVLDVLELLADGMTAGEIVEQLPALELDDVRASLLFAARVLENPQVSLQIEEPKGVSE